MMDHFAYRSILRRLESLQIPSQSGTLDPLDTISRVVCRMSDKSLVNLIPAAESPACVCVCFQDDYVPSEGT